MAPKPSPPKQEPRIDLGTAETAPRESQGRTGAKTSRASEMM